MNTNDDLFEPGDLVYSLYFKKIIGVYVGYARGNYNNVVYLFDGCCIGTFTYDNDLNISRRFFRQRNQKR